MTWQDLQQEILSSNSVLPALAETSPVHAAPNPAVLSNISAGSPAEDVARDDVLALVNKYLSGDPVFEREIQPGSPSYIPPNGSSAGVVESINSDKTPPPSLLGGLLSPGSTALELAGVPEQFIPGPAGVKYPPISNLIMQSLGAVPSDRAAVGNTIDSAVLGPALGGVGKLAKTMQAGIPAAGAVAKGAKNIDIARKLFGNKGLQGAADASAIMRSPKDATKSLKSVRKLQKKLPEGISADLEKSIKTLPPDIVKLFDPEVIKYLDSIFPAVDKIKKVVK